MAQALNRLLGDPAALENYRQRISTHLAKYSKFALLDAYEAAILDAVTNDAGTLASPHR